MKQRFLVVFILIFGEAAINSYAQSVKSAPAQIPVGQKRDSVRHRAMRYVALIPHEGDNEWKAYAFHVEGCPYLKRADVVCFSSCEEAILAGYSPDTSGRCKAKECLPVFLKMKAQREQREQK